MPARGGGRRLKVTEVNAHVMCTLCEGYLVDATAIMECLHAFCRACIVRYLETSKFCPVCDVQVHKTRPLLSIRSDQTLQDLVYKIVPDLYRNEMQRRRDFYAQHPEASVAVGGPGEGDPEDRGEGEPRFFYLKEPVSLCLRLRLKETKSAEPPDAKDDDPTTRHLKCPAALTVGHLKKFVRLKFSLPSTLAVEMFYEDHALEEGLTLMDVAYIHSWKRAEPMQLHYTVSKRIPKPPPAAPPPVPKPEQPSKPPETTVNSPEPMEVDESTTEQHRQQVATRPEMSEDALPAEPTLPASGDDVATAAAASFPADVQPMEVEVATTTKPYSSPQQQCPREEPHAPAPPTYNSVKVVSAPLLSPTNGFRLKFIHDPELNQRTLSGPSSSKKSGRKSGGRSSRHKSVPVRLARRLAPYPPPPPPPPVTSQYLQQQQQQHHLAVGKLLPSVMTTLPAPAYVTTLVPTSCRDVTNDSPCSTTARPSQTASSFLNRTATVTVCHSVPCTATSAIPPVGVAVPQERRDVFPTSSTGNAAAEDPPPIPGKDVGGNPPSTETSVPSDVVPSSSPGAATTSSADTVQISVTLIGEVQTNDSAGSDSHASKTTTDNIVSPSNPNTTQLEKIRETVTITPASVYDVLSPVPIRTCVTTAPHQAPDFPAERQQSTVRLKTTDGGGGATTTPPSAESQLQRDSDVRMDDALKANDAEATSTPASKEDRTHLESNVPARPHGEVGSRGSCAGDASAGRLLETNVDENPAVCRRLACTTKSDNDDSAADELCGKTIVEQRHQDPPAAQEPVKPEEESSKTTSPVVVTSSMELNGSRSSVDDLDLGCQSDLVVDEGPPREDSGSEDNDEDLRKKINAIANGKDEEEDADSGRASDASCPARCEEDIGSPATAAAGTTSTSSSVSVASRANSIDHVIKQLYLQHEIGRSTTSSPRSKEGDSGALDLSTCGARKPCEAGGSTRPKAVANPVLDFKHRQQTYLPAPVKQHTACPPAPKHPTSSLLMHQLTASHHQHAGPTPSILQAQLTAGKSSSTPHHHQHPLHALSPYAAAVSRAVVSSSSASSLTTSSATAYGLHNFSPNAAHGRGIGVFSPSMLPFPSMMNIPGYGILPTRPPQLASHPKDLVNSKLSMRCQAPSVAKQGPASGRRLGDGNHPTLATSPSSHPRMSPSILRMSPHHRSASPAPTPRNASPSPVVGGLTIASHSRPALHPRASPTVPSGTSPHRGSASPRPQGASSPAVGAGDGPTSTQCGGGGKVTAQGSRRPPEKNFSAKGFRRGANLAVFNPDPNGFRQKLVIKNLDSSSSSSSRSNNHH